MMQNNTLLNVFRKLFFAILPLIVVQEKSWPWLGHVFKLRRDSEISPFFSFRSPSDSLKFRPSLWWRILTMKGGNLQVMMSRLIYKNQKALL